jgi:peptide/nickel transport system permease protein
MRGRVGTWRAVLGAVLLAAVGLAAALAPALAPYDPWGIVATPLQPPGGSHLLGTDMLGRDVLSGLI